MYGYELWLKIKDKGLTSTDMKTFKTFYLLL